jgi:peptidoglycan/xylan/chitin deacetylase (PgdA/CDA1 family)
MHRVLIGLTLLAALVVVAPARTAGAAVVIQRVTTTRPYVAITLDDFYTANYERRTAIRQLQAANVLHAPLTLCPAGSALVAYTNKALAQAQAIKQLVAAGTYEFCAHTYAHPVMPKLGVPAQAQEILQGAAAIRAFFGRRPIPIFRPPFGSWDGSTQQAAAAVGFPRIVTWSVDTGDSVGPELPPERLVANAARARPGDIILLHANRTSSAVALPRIITLLRAKGLTPVLLSTLLASGTPVYVTRPSYRRPVATPTTSRPTGARPANSSTPGATGQFQPARVGLAQAPPTSAPVVISTSRSIARPTLRYGASGAAVQELQRRLNRWMTVSRPAGLAPLVVDGIFGPRTGAAVRAYQRAHRLAVDGIVGPHTWRSLLGP